MAGLIQTAINKQDPTKSIAGYDPDKIKLDPTSDLVEGRVENIIRKDNPLMQQARTRSKQAANQRGLLNTSMAVQAGESAVYDAAMPIASQDAQTSFQTKQLNTNAANTAHQFTADAQNKAASQVLAGNQNLQTIEAQTDAQSQLMKQKADIDLQLQSASAEDKEQLLQQQGLLDQEMARIQGLQQLEQLNIRGDQAETLARLDNEFRTILQANQSAGGFFASTSEAISQILSQPDIPGHAKDALIQRQLELLQSGLSVIGGISNLDLTSLLTFDLQRTAIRDEMPVYDPYYEDFGNSNPIRNTYENAKPHINKPIIPNFVRTPESRNKY